MGNLGHTDIVLYIYLVLNVRHTDLLNTILQYFTIMWFKSLSLYQALNGCDILSPITALV